MDNLAATKSLCNAICSTFYPDAATAATALFNAGIDPEAEAAAKDPAIFRVAARLVLGYVDGSRSEGGVSMSVRSDQAIKRSLRLWCGEYGIDVDEVMPGELTVIDNATDLW